MKSSEDSEMAIHVEHVGVLERAREVSRLEEQLSQKIMKNIEAESLKWEMIPPG